MNSEAKVPDLETRQRHVTNTQAACQKLEALNLSLRQWKLLSQSALNNPSADKLSDTFPKKTPSARANVQ
jgi:hypothetical protein